MKIVNRLLFSQKSCIYYKMFEWVLNASLLPVKKNEKLSYMKNFMAPFYE